MGKLPLLLSVPPPANQHASLYSIALPSAEARRLAFLAEPRWVEVKTSDQHACSLATLPYPPSQVLAVKPRKGDAVLFHSIKPTGEWDKLVGPVG